MGKEYTRDICKGINTFEDKKKVLYCMMQGKNEVESILGGNIELVICKIIWVCTMREQGFDNKHGTLEREVH